MPDDDRELTAQERAFLQHMLGGDDPNSRAFWTQLQNARVKTIDELGSLAIAVQHDDPVAVRDGPFVSAMQADVDTVENYGPYIQYILFVRKGYACELQVYKDDDSPINLKFVPERVAYLTPGNP